MWLQSHEGLNKGRELPIAQNMNTTSTISARQYQRVPFVFPLRFRPDGAAEAWQTGIGIDLSVGGLACLLPVLPPPAPGTIYELELVLYFPDCSREQLRIRTEVRWSTAIPDGSKLGLQVSDCNSRVRLARALLPL